jgi:ABC-type branched-subunit amino acid transport system substrate-binding protein
MRRVLAVITVTLVTVALVGIQTITAGAGGGGGKVPGVTKSEIRVGGYASPPNDTLNVAYPDGFDGVEAYFEKTNKAGGVNGRKLKLIAKKSDQGQASTGAITVRSLVEDDNVFAVLPIMTNSFTLGGKYLFDNDVPGFGINVEPAWCGTADEQTAIESALLQDNEIQLCPRENLFGEKGSFLCFECPGVAPSYIATQRGYTKVAVFGYTHISSTRCVNGVISGFEKYGIEVAHSNQSLEFGFSVSELAADIQAMKDEGVQFVATCMEFNGGFKISEGLRQAGVNDVVFYAPEGYKQSTLEKAGDALEGWIFRLGFAPWQGEDLPKGTRQFLKAMKKRGVEPSEHNQAGWINAALFVEGLELAGKNPTRESLIEAINGITDFTADGMVPPIGWQLGGGGHSYGYEACDVYEEVQDGEFVTIFGQPGQPIVCFPLTPALPDSLDEPYFRPLKAGETAPTLVPEAAQP